MKNNDELTLTKSIFKREKLKFKKSCCNVGLIRVVLAFRIFYYWYDKNAINDDHSHTNTHTIFVSKFCTLFFICLVFYDVPF